jgi:hypothetical protein
MVDGYGDTTYKVMVVGVLGFSFVLFAAFLYYVFLDEPRIWAENCGFFVWFWWCGGVSVLWLVLCVFFGCVLRGSVFGFG